MQNPPERQDLLRLVESTPLVGAGWSAGGPLAGTEELAVEDPGRGEVIGAVREADPQTVQGAVDAAVAAFGSGWGRSSGQERAEVLSRIAALLREETATIAALESLDTGKPLSQARGDVGNTVRYFEYFAARADKIEGEVLPQPGEELVYSLREPLGVVAHITPWNAPLSQMARGVAPCLAVGNTVVVKPSELTPYSTLYAAELFERAGLPPGVCNVLIGRGTSVGASLAANPAVRHVTFTGSVAAGAEVAAATGARVAGCSLELGGKSPTILCADGDITAAARAAALAIARNAGQTCFATTRQIVQERLLEPYVEELLRQVRGLQVGYGLSDPDLGPMVSAAHLERVAAYVASGRDEGAEVAIGGGRAEEAGRGHFHQPTVFVGVENHMRIAQEEIFGPVQCVLPFGDLEEAIELANDTPYGLAAGVFTRDLSTAHRVAARLDAGQVQVNRFGGSGPDVPFGGYKQSGLGREKGTEAIRHYTQVKSVLVAL